MEPGENVWVQPSSPITADASSGLQYVVITPSLTEWTSTFGESYIDEYGPIHIWIKCLNHLLRFFFFVENLQDGVVGVSAKQNSIMMKRRLYFTLNGVKYNGKVSFTNGGGEFYMELTHDQQNILYIGVVDWLQHAMVNTMQCNKWSPKQINQHPELIILVYTWDNTDVQRISVVAEAISRHFYYHHCVLNITRYEILIQREQLDLYLNNAGINKAVKDGYVRFTIKGNHPPMITKKTPKWQGIYENMAILQYWGQSVRLLFWDPDEYLLINPKYQVEFNKHLMENGVVNIKRKSIICTDCPQNITESNLSFHHHQYVHFFHNIAVKSAINPNRAGCYYVHVSWCDYGNTIKLEPRIAYMVHFENFFGQRFYHNKVEGMTPRPDMKLAINPVNISLEGLYSCDPYSRFLHENLKHSIHHNLSHTIGNISRGEKEIPMNFVIPFDFYGEISFQKEIFGYLKRNFVPFVLGVICTIIFRTVWRVGLIRRKRQNSRQGV